MAKVSKADLPKIMELRGRRLSNAAIGRKFGVSGARIIQVAGSSGKRKLHSRETIATARSLWSDGLTMTEVAQRLGVDRDAMAGIVHRNDFAERPSPIKRIAK